MSFNGSAVASMESEVMIKNVVMNVMSRNTRVTYGQNTSLTQTDKDKRKWRQMAGRGVKMYVG